LQSGFVCSRASFAVGLRLQSGFVCKVTRVTAIPDSRGLVSEMSG
jgi:hypothetical protein